MQDSTFTSPCYPGGTRRGDVFAADCPTRQLLDRIGDKWAVLILGMLSAAPLRFNALKRRIGGISQKMLSQTLRSLERDGLVARSVEATMPVTVTYSITPLGQSLAAALRGMIDWAETRMGDVAASQAAFDARLERG